MRTHILTLALCFIFTQSFGQTQRKFSTYLLSQYNHTVADYTKGNNPWAVGLGLQSQYNNTSKFKPLVELTADIYLQDDKLFRSNPDGTFPQNGNDVRGMINLFFGSSFHPKQRIYLSIAAGPSFIHEQTLLGIKPSVGFYFSKNQRWTGKISYINILNRTKIIDKDFESISIAIGLRLF